MAQLMVFSGSSNRPLAERIVNELRIDLGRSELGRFSDGEANVEIHENVRGCDAFILQSTCAPTNDNIMELVIMADA
ncbi:MAG: ribose-phosphate pyrophosphokinase-like domain-containing protein, partial [Gammaproteobacteria bacterium]|nr:ribose-phosphate pyrophosphokinase-like domain-containing protein [Gammaproteobacteria bacterium]